MMTVQNYSASCQTVKSRFLKEKHYSIYHFDHQHRDSEDIEKRMFTSFLLIKYTNLWREGGGIRGNRARGGQFLCMCSHDKAYGSYLGLELCVELPPKRRINHHPVDDQTQAHLQPTIKQRPCRARPLPKLMFWWPYYKIQIDLDCRIIKSRHSPTQSCNRGIYTYLKRGSRASQQANHI